jgi:lipid II:glycine glycyltransferase (peptidoglycan interpeptide bridge formation enzyme)
MEIKILEDKNIWNEFLNTNNYISFLQDFEYGELEKDFKREVIRLALKDKEILGLCQIIGYLGKRKGLVVHHGPITKDESLQTKFILEILKFLKENKYDKKYNFLRINPVLPIEKIKGFISAPTYAVTENFWIKEIKDDETMLKEMNTSTKKLIIDSLKKPFLEIEKTNNLDKLEIFWQIYQDLAKRKKFVPYPKNFIKKEFEIFSKENKALLFLGKVENKYYSAALIIFSHKIAFYHHSASYPIKEPLNYKLQWEIIQEAKNRGCKFYNLWGIAKKEDKNHPWYGLTQFKKSFGGQLIKLPSTIDYPFSLKYYLNYIYEKIKRRKL